MIESFPTFLGDRVRILTGDITTHDVTAIVNAANSTLLGGGGVDGAIHRTGGPQILAECKQIRETTHPNGLPTGEAVITTGGNLVAQYVIHTVGPIYGRNPGREAELLAACYQNSLRLGREYAISSIAFPSISTGAYGYPKPEAAAIASRSIKDFLSADNQIQEVRLVFFQPRDARVFLEYQKFE
ncbi:MAG TPA: O-acetyl-ADP-ribose deacetylase [Pyrinomonadaceae bacterium]|nr:O-acetyl-ADP-ribose deacetylase [Pyrinomonadaceae bacterium]